MEEKGGVGDGCDRKMEFGRLGEAEERRTPKQARKEGRIKGRRKKEAGKEGHEGKKGGVLSYIGYKNTTSWASSPLTLDTSHI